MSAAWQWHAARAIRKSDDGKLLTHLGMWWYLQPTEKVSEFPLTFGPLPFFGSGLCEWRTRPPCDRYLPCVGIRLRCERQADFALLNAGQFEHGDHSVRVDVELNIGTD